MHIFRHYPLTSIHPNAMPAAEAAYCAGQQNPAWFWGMHDWFFANQQTWSSAIDAETQFRDQALAIGVNADEFDACLDAAETEAAIQRDLQEGSQMGVSGTPAFFVNDWFLNGAVPYEQFVDRIEKAQSGVHPPPTPTPLPPGVAPYDADPTREGRTYDNSPSMGSPDAPLVLIAFEDFKCSFCARHATEVEPVLRERYVDTGELRLVFKFFPIYAPEAAVASLCAQEQGAFWEYHDLLFEQQSEWEEGDTEAFAGYASDLGLDETAFRQCVEEAPGRQQIEDDGALAQQVGAQGTPFFLLLDPQGQTGLRLPGALPLEQFESAIQQMLNPATPAP